MEGWMWKKGAAKALGGTCKRRWFKLQILVVSSDQKGGEKQKRLALTYFKSREHAAAGAKKLLGHIDLTAASAIDSADPSSLGSDKVAHCRQYAFHVVTPKRTWCLVPEEASELLRWVSKLHDVLPGGIVASPLLQSARGFVVGTAASDSEPDDGAVESAGGSPRAAAGASKDNGDGGADSAPDGAAGDDRLPGRGGQEAGTEREAAAQPVVRGDGVPALTTQRPPYVSAENGRRLPSDGSGSGRAATDAEVVRLRAELEAAQMTIAELKRSNHELTERLEMRDVDARQVLGLDEPLLANFGLGRAGKGARAKRSINGRQRTRRGTDPDEEFDDGRCCQCAIQ